MTNNKTLFYSAIAIAVLVTEVSNRYGFGICAFLPSVLLVYIIGLKVFPPKS